MKIIYNFYHGHKKTVLLFLIVGLSSAIVNFGSFALLWQVMHIDYRIAVSFAYMAAVTVHFFANRNLTFKARNTHTLHQLPKYFTMIGINYLVTLFVVHIVVEKLNQSPYVGLVAAIGVTMGINYTLLRFWVFTEKKCSIL